MFLVSACSVMIPSVPSRLPVECKNNFDVIPQQFFFFHSSANNSNQKFVHIFTIVFAITWYATSSTGIGVRAQLILLPKLKSTIWLRSGTRLIVHALKPHVIFAELYAQFFVCFYVFFGNFWGKHWSVNQIGTAKRQRVKTFFSLHEMW